MSDKRFEMSRLGDAFSDLIKSENAPKMGFYPSVFAQTSLPYQNPQDMTRWTYVNGNMTLTVTPGQVKDCEEMVNLGIPYGALPRLIILYLASEAVKTKSREINLGSNITEFLEELGRVPDSRGRKRLIDQAARLFSSTFQFTGMKNGILCGKNMPMVAESQLWMGSKGRTPDLFQARVKLDESFYDEFIATSMPINLSQLRGISNKPMAIDIYTWLIRRLGSVNAQDKPLAISWNALKDQFGQGRAQQRDFVATFKKDLNAIETVWPKLKVSHSKEFVLIEPSDLPIKQLN